MSNTITAYFKGRTGVAESVYQNDYGIVLAFDDIYLPAHFDCYFTVSGSDTAIPGVGADNRVVIPNTVLATSGKVEVHIPLHTGLDDSEVEYVAYFKVIGRARPVDDGTPEQMTAVEKSIALLQEPITNIEQIVNEALSFTGETFEEMQEDLDEWKDGVEEGLTTWKGGVEDDINEVEGDFATLQSQFDTALAALTVDSECADIRVGDDGVTYTSAGEAVRTQFSDVKAGLSYVQDCFASKNLIDTSKLTSGKYVDNTTGSLVSVTGYNATDFIPVEPNVPYTYSLPTNENVRPMAFYDENKDYVSGFNGLGEYGVYTFTVPNGCYYVRWSIVDANIPYAQLEKGTQATAYEPFTLELNGKNVNAEETATSLKTAEAFAPIESKNLIDLSACIVGKYVDSGNGKLGTHASYSATDYIPVEAGETYTFSICGFPEQAVERYAMYDENKAYVTGSLNSYVYGKVSFTVPSGCHYIRWSLWNDYKAFSQLEKGSVATEYENYRKYIHDKYMHRIVKTVGASGCDFTSLLEALKSTDATVELHLKKGTYDIVAEYEDYYGASFWSNYAGYSGAGATDPFNKGLWLEKGRRIIGEAGAIISFPYTGNNDNVKEKFSIFANDTDVLLENLTITANPQCCRYAIHDDFQPNGGVIEFRKLLFDMTPNKHAVIGAGLGIDTTYIIDNCVFENNSKSFDIHYHGNTVANQDTHCKFFITNCYGSKYCYFGYYGDSTEVSDAIVNNCAFQNVECSAYSGATFANIRLIQWNNTRV